MSESRVVSDHDATQVVPKLEQNIWYSPAVEAICTQWRSYAEIKNPIEKREARFKFICALQNMFLTCDLALIRDIIEVLCHQVHGAEYDYSQLIVKGPVKFTEKIPVVCSKHGTFLVRLLDHLIPPNDTQYAVGCNTCLMELKLGKGGTLRKNTTMFITDAELVHNIKYDYRLVKYKILFEKIFDIGNEAYHLEQHIITIFNQYRYKQRKRFLKVGGNTELFKEETIPHILEFLKNHASTN